MRKSFCSAVIACTLTVLLILPPPAEAWGNSGHEAVAYVAWNLMQPKTREAVYKLLQQVPPIPSKNSQDPDIEGYDEWVKELPSGLSPDQKKLYIFMRAATWADSIKHKFLRDTDDPKQDGDHASDNIGFSDGRSHGYWHFVDTPFGTASSSDAPDTDVPKACWVGKRDKAPPKPVKTLPKDAPSPNAVKQITDLTAAMKSTEAAELKAYDLLWLEHLVGDIHQPLHATVRYANGIADEGGNCVQISIAGFGGKFKPGWQDDKTKGYSSSKSFRAPEELHAFWDSLPGTASARNVAFAANYAETLKKTNGNAKINDPQTWADESFALAGAVAYHNPIGAGLGYPTRYAITQTYYTKAKKTADSQIYLAGARLAALLDDIFK